MAGKEWIPRISLPSTAIMANTPIYEPNNGLSFLPVTKLLCSTIDLDVSLILLYIMITYSYNKIKVHY